MYNVSQKNERESAMKKWNVIIICLILCSVIVCSNETAKDILITGIVKNPSSSQIKIQQQTVTLNPAGQFRFVQPSNKPDYFVIDFGKEFTLYLKPGDRISLEIETDKGLQGIVLSGDRLEINHFLIELAIESENVNAYFDQNYQDLFTLPEQAYFNQINQLWQPFSLKLEEFRNQNRKQDKHFFKTIQASISYSWANLLIRYPEWHRQFTGDLNFIPTDNYFKFMERLDLNDPELLEVEEYGEFLNHYLIAEADKTLRQSPKYKNQNYKPFRAKMDVTLDTFSDPIIRSEMLYAFIPALLKDYYHKGIDDLILQFRQNCVNQNHKDEMEKLRNNDKAIRDNCSIQVYKTIGDVTLDVFVYRPSDLKKGEKRPALAFFHGGGWECGKPEWGQMQCEHFSSLGLVSFSFEYRLTTQHDATPVESIEDAKSALRWMREHSDEFGIDPHRIVASGYSAGGHLAACTAMIDSFDHPKEDHTISSKANALMFWVTPFRVFEDGWFGQILKGRARIEDCDPSAHIRPDLPPSIIFQGTKDDLVPFLGAKEFADKMKAAGNRCDLHLYEGQTHLSWGDNNLDVLQKMDKFLESIGFFDF